MTHDYSIWPPVVNYDNQETVWLSYWDAEQVARESKDEAAIASVKAHRDFKLNGSQWVAQVFRPCLKCGHNVMPDAINYHYYRCEHCDHRVDFSKGSNDHQKAIK